MLQRIYTDTEHLFNNFSFSILHYDQDARRTDCDIGIFEAATVQNTTAFHQCRLNTVLISVDWGGGESYHCPWHEVDLHTTVYSLDVVQNLNRIGWYYRCIEIYEINVAQYVIISIT